MESISSLIARMAIGCLSNDPAVLNTNLLASPAVRAKRLPVVVEENPTSAAKGYNAIMSRTDAEYLILSHNDVYLPTGWEERLAHQINAVSQVDPNWGVIAAYGVDQNGGGWGPVWSTSIGQIMGRVPMAPTAITVADELLIVVRRANGLEFDEALDHFHFYGLDIVQTALSLGMGAWSVALPCVHHDSFKGALRDEHYDRSFDYVRRKWRHALPIYAPTIKVTWHGLQLRNVKKRMKESLAHRQDIATQAQACPITIAAQCGWEEAAKISSAAG